MARGGLGWQTRASNPNLAQGRKVKLRAGKQLFAALPGMQEQSWVAGIWAGATGSSALKEEVADPFGEVGTLPRQGSSSSTHGQPLSACCNRDAWLYSQQCCCELATLCWRDKKSPPWDKQTVCVKLNLCTGARAWPTLKPHW